MSEWFEEWFGEEYLALYPHRDVDDAARLIGLLTREIKWGPGWRVLDIACGPGRHAAALDRAGLCTVGVDLSIVLLRKAREVTQCPLVRGDLRQLPFRRAGVDAALNLFTSFGYFETDDEHAAALREMTAVVRSGGWFVLDYLHDAPVRTALRGSVTDLSPGLPGTVRLRRRLTRDGRFVVKDILLPDGRHFIERVRLFSPAELTGLLRDAGVMVQQTFGDYDGGPMNAQAPRCLLLGRTT